MKKTAFILILLPVVMMSLATSVIAQQTEFTKVYYDGAGSAQAYAIVKTSSNDLLVAGYWDNKPYAMMLDPQGNILWANCYGSANGNIFSIAPTNDGDFILAGNMTPSGSTQDDILLIKITNGGDTVWSKTIDLGYIDKAMFVMQTSDNGFLLTGYSRNSAVPHYKSFAMKLDSTVSLSWVKTYYAGSYFNYLYSAAENPDGSFLLAGSAGNGNLNSGGVLLMKIASTGDLIWSKNQPATFPVSSSGNDLKIFPDGIIWYLTDTNSQMSLLKTDPSGNFLWCKSYGAMGAHSIDFPSAKLHSIPDGGFILVNGSSNQFYPMGTLIKVDSEGNVAWGRFLYLLASDVVRSGDNGYVVAGNGPLMGVDMSQVSSPQVGLIKFDSSGNTVACADIITINTAPSAVPLYPVTLTIGSAGIIMAYHPQVTPASLAADSNCVAVIGGVSVQKDASSLSIIPNPSGGIFRLDLHSTENERISSIRIFNSLGSKVYGSDTRENQELAFNLDFLPTGIYEIIAFAGSNSYTRKMMIIR